jgi:hypothetical protein
MAGQPNFPGWLVFDVTDLTVGDNTVRGGDNIDITVNFTGSGGIWAFLEWLSDNIGPNPGVIGATAQFYAEGMGIGAGEYDLGSVVTPLAVAAAGSYSASITVNTGAAPTNLAEGVYRIQCLVQVGNSGIMGFPDKDLLLSVYV